MFNVSGILCNLQQRTDQIKFALFQLKKRWAMTVSCLSQVEQAWYLIKCQAASKSVLSICRYKLKCLGIGKFWSESSCEACNRCWAAWIDSTVMIKYGSDELALIEHAKRLASLVALWSTRYAEAPLSWLSRRLKFYDMHFFEWSDIIREC